MSKTFQAETKHMGNILVIDVGTSSMRATLFSPQGEALNTFRSTYSPTFLDGGAVEQDPAIWADSLHRLTKASVHWAREQGQSIEAISLTSQRSSAIAVDSAGQPLHPAIMWQDTRTSGQCNAMREHMAMVYSRTGLRISPVLAAPKFSWLKKERPEAYKRAHKLLTIADYLVFLMTGRFVTDYTYGSRTLLMNLHTLNWDSELLRLFDVDADKLCELVPQGGIVGHTTDDFRSATALPSGTPLISAGGDQQCGALGTGILAPGSIQITTGTGSYAIASSERLHLDPEMKILCSVSAVPGQFILEASILATSALYAWVGKTLYDGITDADDLLRRLAEDAAATAIGANGVITLPHFQGRGSPDWNSEASGMLANLTLATTRSDIVRSALEGIAAEIGGNVDVAEPSGRIKRDSGIGRSFQSPALQSDPGRHVQPGNLGASGQRDHLAGRLDIGFCRAWIACVPCRCSSTGTSWPLSYGVHTDPRQCGGLPPTASDPHPLVSGVRSIWSLRNVSRFSDPRCEAMMDRSTRTWPLFMSAAVGIGIYGIAFAVLGTVLGLPEMQARLHLDTAHKGTIFLLLYTGVFVSNAVSGPLLEAFGNKAVLATSAAMVSASLLWFAAMTSFPAGACSAVILGFGGGSLNVAVNALVSEIYPAKRGAMLNFLGVFFGVGALSLPLTTATLLSHVGIAQLFLISATLPAAAAILYLSLSFPTQQVSRGIPLLDAARVLRYPGVLAVGMLLFFENANEAVIAAWTSIYAISLGFTPHTATLILSCYWASMMAGRAAASLLIKRLGKMPIILGAAAGAIVGCTLLFNARTPLATALAVGLTGLSFAPIFKTTLSIAGDRHPHAIAPIYGVVFAMSLLGAMSAPWMVGQISQHYGIQYGPLVPICGSFCVGIMAIIIGRSNLPATRAIPTPEST